MASSDDEDEVWPLSASNYHSVDDEDASVSFSLLSFQWSESETESVNEKKKKKDFLAWDC